MKVKSIDNIIRIIVSLFVTYPAICFVFAASVYSFLPENNHGIKTIPLEVYTWIEGQKHKASADGYLTIDKCLDAQGMTDTPPRPVACKNFGTEQISVEDAATAATNAALMFYMGLVVCGAFLMVAVKIATGGLKSMLMPMYDLFKELFVTLYGLLTKKPR